MYTARALDASMASARPPPQHQGVLRRKETVPL